GLFLCGFISSESVASTVAQTNQDFSAVSKAVVELLQSRDAVRFAKELSPAIDDWKSVLTTNASGADPETLAGFQRDSEYFSQRIEQGAKQLLAKADSLHV